MAIQPYPRPLKAKVKKQTDDQLVKIGQLNDLVQQTNTAIAAAAGGSFSKNGAKIDVITDVFSTTFENNITVDSFYSIDADLYNAAILEYTMFSETYAYTGSVYFYKYKLENTFTTADPTSSAIQIYQSEPVGSIVPLKLNDTYGDTPNGTSVQMIYTFKLYRVPLYYN